MSAFRDTRKGSRGFSLVELMIALVIGLLLLAGVLQILLSNRQSFDAQRGRAHLQENARLASYALENAVAHAGFHSDLESDWFQSFPSTTATAGGFQRGAVVSGTANTRGDSDTLRIRFQSAGGVHTCLGGEVGDIDSPKQSVFEFRLSADGDALLCEVLSGPGAGPVAQPIVENVDRFEVRYGLDTDSEIGIDRYVSDLSGFDASKVRSVRVQLLLRNGEGEDLLPTPSVPDFIFSDRSNTSGLPADRHGRLMLDQTIALRNTLP